MLSGEAPTTPEEDRELRFLRSRDLYEVPDHLRAHVAQIQATKHLRAQTHFLRKSHIQTGGGLKRWVANTFETVRKLTTDRQTGRTALMAYRLMPKSASALNASRDHVVTGMWIGRKHLASMNSTLMRKLTSGEVNESSLSFDDLYHLFLVIVTDIGSYVYEKHVVVNYEPFDSSEYANMVGVESRNISVLARFTVGDFFTSALDVMGEIRYYTYDAFNNNCQNFVNDSLEASARQGRISYTQSERKFVLQDVSELTSQIDDETKSIVRGITDTANKAHTMIYGEERPMKELSDLFDYAHSGARMTDGAASALQLLAANMPGLSPGMRDVFERLASAPTIRDVRHLAEVMDSSGEKMAAPSGQKYTLSETLRGLVHDRNVPSQPEPSDYKGIDPDATGVGSYHAGAIHPSELVGVQHPDEELEELLGMPTREDAPMMFMSTEKPVGGSYWDYLVHRHAMTGDA